MPNTHCLPTGSLATGEEPVPAVPMGVTVNGPAPGSRRGIVILVPGLTGSAMPCPPLNADVTGLLPGYFATLMLNLNRDGWLTAYLPNVGYNYYSGQLPGLQNLVATDTGHGTLYLNAALRWWDHVVWWVQQNYGSTMPIVVWGLSWGGWHSFQIAKARTSTISAYIAMVPAEPLWTFQIANMAGGAASTTTVTNTYTWPLTSPTVVTVNSVAGFSAGGGVVVIQAALEPVLPGNSLAVVASTLGVALLFQPLRRRIQSAMDRRFDRSRYNAERTIDTLAGRLRGRADLTDVSRDILMTAVDSVHPASISIWLRVGTARDRVDA